jgi:hypothetical protein
MSARFHHGAIPLVVFCFGMIAGAVSLNAASPTPQGTTVESDWLRRRSIAQSSHRGESRRPVKSLTFENTTLHFNVTILL